MTPEAKIRILAQQDSELQAYFFTGGQIRWFDEQLQPGYLRALTPTQVAGGMSATCARVNRLGTKFSYTHETSTNQAANRLQRPVFQIDVLDYDPERARAATRAIRDWFGRVDFSTDSQFASPVTSPRQHPNFVRNQFPLKDPALAQLQPRAYGQAIEVEIYNLEE